MCDGGKPAPCDPADTPLVVVRVPNDKKVSVQLPAGCYTAEHVQVASGVPVLFGPASAAQLPGTQDWEAGEGFIVSDHHPTAFCHDGARPLSAQLLYASMAPSVDVVAVRRLRCQCAH